MNNNEFADDELRQGRSRRRFQTGLLIFLLLFFMDAKTPQESQGRSRRTAQARTTAKNQETTARTVHRLAEQLEEHVSHGSSYALREASTIKGEWHRSDGEGFRTVVPAMDKKVGEGNGSKNRPDLRNETIAPHKAGTVRFKLSRMTASLVKDKGNPEVSTVHGVLNLGPSVAQTSVDTLFEGLFFHKYGHLSAVVGASGDALRVVWPSDLDTPVATASGEDAAVAAPLSTASPPLDGSVGGERLAVGSANANDTVAPGGDAADIEEHTAVVGGDPSDPPVGDTPVTTEVEAGDSGGGGGGGGGSRDNPRGEGEIIGEDEETREGIVEEAGQGGDGEGRRRVLPVDNLIPGAEGGGGGGGGGSGGRGSGLARFGWGAGATERASASASASAVAGSEGMAGGGWRWSDKQGPGEEGADGASGGRRRSAGDSGDDGSKRTPDSRSLAGPERNLSDQPPPAGPGSDAAESPDAAAADMVKLDASLTGDVKDKDDGTTTAAAAAPDANGEGQEEGEAGTGATVGGDADGRGASADGAEGTSPLKREFPAMVLPGAAVVAAGQESGPLPSQWYNLRTEYGEGCLFLLTLQTVEEDEGDGDQDVAGGDGVVETGSGEAETARKPLADLMRGELVGVNCDFSAVIEVQLSSSNVVSTEQSQAMSYTVVFTMVCLLQMCLLCCRVGLMLARRRYGRNFMVPRRFQPPKFDYHRPIPPALTAQTGTETASGQHSEETRDLEAGNCLECAICYAAVDSALEDYMLTPCDHVFHQGCLTRWMNIKMECPTCRRELPPQLERA